MNKETLKLTELKQLLNKIPCGTGIFDIDTSLPLFLNDECYHIGGYKSDDFKTHEEYFLKVFVLSSEQNIAQMCTDDPIKELEYNIICKDGSNAWLKLDASEIFLDEKKYALVTFKDITEDKKPLTADTFEHERYEIVVNELSAAVFEWNLKTGEFYRSPAYYNYAMSEISSDDILHNRGSLDVVHPDDMPVLLQFFADTASGKKKAECTLRSKMTDGSYHWSKMLGYFFTDEHGVPSRTIGIVIDINDDRERELMMSSLLNECPGGVAVFKVTNKLECDYFSDGFAKISGRTREELDKIIKEGKLIETVISQSDRHLVKDAMIEFSEKKQTVNRVFRCVAKDGTARWLNLNVTKMHEEDGFPVYYCIFTITSDETSHFRSVVEDSAIGVLVAERKSRRVIYMNDALFKIYDIDSEMVNTESRFIDVVDNKKLLLTQDEIDGLSSNSYSEFHIAYNNDIYLSIRGRALYWNSVDAYILYVTDESEEHSRQLRLQELIDNIPGGVGIFDLYGGTAHQVYLNDRFYDLISDKRENRIYRNDTDFFMSVYPDDLDSIKKAIMELSAKDIDQVSFDYRSKNGSDTYTWLHVVARAVNRLKEKTVIYCCFTDISDAVEYKEAIERTNAVIQTQYSQELERRKILEKGSFVNTCTNITKKRVLSINCTDDRFKNLPSEFDFQLAVDVMLKTVPIEDDRKAVAEAMNCERALELFSEGISEGLVEYRSYQPDGTLHWIRFVYDIIEDVHSGDVITYAYYYDIDAQKKAQLSLDSVVNEEIDYVMLYSLHSHTARLVQVNGKLTEATIKGNFSFDEMMSSNIYNFIVGEDRKSTDEFFNEEKLIEELEKASVITITFRKIAPNGEICRKKARAFYLDDTHDDIVIVRRDITDLYEEEQQQKRTLQAAADEAIRANRAKSDFLARMSHDMRTPMNGILGVAGLMKDKSDLNEIKSDLSQLEMSGQYLLRLINDTLDMNKIEEGKLEFHLEPVNGEQLAQNIIANAVLMANEKGVKLQTEEINTNGIKCPAVMIDPARMEQIVMNVISNAIKFTPSGGTVTLGIESISMTDEFIVERYTIKDTGIGMSEEFLAHIFEPFSQEGRMNTDRESGTGLGMSIVRQLVELMNGEISIKSKVNEGTEVALLMKYPVFHGEISTEKKETIDTDILKNKRILLCEDHPLNAKIAMQLLKKGGMQADLAENGKIGAEMFDASKPDYYDAVLMDIRMPVMGGLDAAAAIRSLNRSDAETVPIIALTANAYEEDIKKSIDAGMNAHLAKPIQPKLLYDTLCEFIKNRSANKK